MESTVQQAKGGSDIGLPQNSSGQCGCHIPVPTMHAILLVRSLSVSMSQRKQAGVCRLKQISVGCQAG